MFKQVFADMLIALVNDLNEFSYQDESEPQRECLVAGGPFKLEKYDNSTYIKLLPGYSNQSIIYIFSMNEN